MRSQISLVAAILVTLIAPARAGEPVVGEEVTVVEGAAVASPRAVFAGGSYLVIWQDGWPGANATADIVGVRLAPKTLAPAGEPFKICAADEAQFAPAIAAAGDVALVAWQDFRNGKDLDIRAVRVDAKTGKLLGEEIEVAVKAGNQARPAVAASGEGFLVVWQEARGGGTYGISGARVSKDGKVLDAKPVSYAESGANPVASASGGKYLVAWAQKKRRLSTSAALVDAATGKLEKVLGGKNGINGPCGNGIAIAHDGAGNFMTVAGRESFPNPWGWPGPGAVLLSRVNAGGATPEANLDYAYRLNNVCGRKVPNVVDTATWGKADKWHAGAPGGFKGTRDGLWPNGWPGVAYDGKGAYLFVWVKGKIAPDRLNLTNLNIWLRGMDAKSLAVKVADRKVAAADGVDETRPVLVAGPVGEILLLYERLEPGAARRVAARAIGLAGGE